MTASPFDPTTEQKRAYLEANLTQYKAAHYQHELNLELAEEIGDTAAIEYNTKALAELDVAIGFTERKLQELGA